MNEENSPKLLRVKSQIIKLSASSVKTYSQCPRKYYYTYLDRQPKKQWAHFDLGNLCHKALEIFHIQYKKKPVPSNILPKLMSASFKKARQEFRHMDIKLVQEAKDLLLEYLRSVMGNMPNVESVEADFHFNISKDVAIRGFVDRLDMLDVPMYHIVDYKTTKNKKYLDPFQLKLYGLWLKEKIDPNIKRFKASYCLLRHNSAFQEYEFNEKDIEDTRKELLKYAQMLREEDKWEPVPTRLCGWCDFQDVCPAHQSW